jgi:hypothetical protein
MPFVAKTRLAMLVPNHQYQDAIIGIAVNDGIWENLKVEKFCALWLQVFQILGDVPTGRRHVRTLKEIAPLPQFLSLWHKSPTRLRCRFPPQDEAHSPLGKL